MVKDWVNKFHKISREQKFRLFLKMLNPSSDDRILDAGAEKGLYFEEKYVWKKNIVALDINRNNLVLLKRKYREVLVIQGDVCNLPFKDNSFDIIFSNAVIEHVGNSERQMEFAKEIMRVGKKWFVTTPNRFFPFELHVYLPFIHYFPQKIQKYIMENIYPGETWNVNLLTASKTRNLFQGSTIVKQKITIWSETIIAYYKGEDRARCLQEK